MLVNIIFIIGLFLIIFSLVLKTQNFRSSFIFKVIPFFMGAYLIFYVFVVKEIFIIK